MTPVPTVTPYPTPTMFPTPIGTPIINLAPVANALVGQKIATEVVAMWNYGMGPHWDNISMFILILIVLGRFAIFFKDFSKVTDED